MFPALYWRGSIHDHRLRLLPTVSYCVSDRVYIPQYCEKTPDSRYAPRGAIFTQKLLKSGESNRIKTKKYGEGAGITVNAPPR